MSKIIEIKRDYKDNVEKDFNDLIAEWGNENGRNEDEILYELLFILKTYFEHIRELDPNEPCFDLNPVIDRISRKTKYNTKKEQYLFGCFVFGLKLFGSSWEQAYKAMSQYQGDGPDKYKKARYEFIRQMHDKEMNKEEFVSLYGYTLKNIVEDTQESFPSDLQIKKARKAYEHLMKAIEADIKAVD